MIRLLYCSQAKYELTSEVIEEILLKSRKNNRANQITGVLAYGGGLFLQVLEGPEQAVLRTYVRILDDKRHTDSRIIHISPARDRLFKNWSMGAVQRNPMDFEHLALLRSNRTESVNAEAFMHVMRQFDQLLVEKLVVA